MIAADTMNPTAEHIRQLRRRHAMTQEDLAARSGCGLATIQRAERGRPLSPDSLAAIAAAFDVPASDLCVDPNGNFEPYLPLRPISTGRELVSLLAGERGLDFSFCELDNLDDARLIEGFLDLCRQIAADGGGVSPVAQVTRELEAKQRIAALRDRGFRVGGADFQITAYDVDDDCGSGPGVIMAQWDETRVALRVGRTLEDIARAHVMDGLGPYESPKGDAVVFPPPDDAGWADVLGGPQTKEA